MRSSKNKAQAEFSIIKGVLTDVSEERKPWWGAEASERASVKGSEAPRLDNGYHNRPYKKENEDVRLSMKEWGVVHFYPQGKGIRIKLGRKKRNEDGWDKRCLKEIYCPERYEEEKRLERAKRGIITRFTRSSRDRLREDVLRLHKGILPWFVTLTFPDEFPTPRAAHRHLKVYFQRIKRIYENLGAIWKLEYKARKSGKRQGEMAPHFHIMMWGVTISAKDFESLSKRIWFEIVGSGDQRHKRRGCDVTEIYDYQGIKHYFKKYFYKTYEYENEQGIGRCWGVVGRIPYSETVTCVITSTQGLKLIRTLKKHEINYKKWLDKVSYTFKYNGVRKYKRLHEKDDIEAWMRFYYNNIDNVPF